MQAEASYAGFAVDQSEPLSTDEFARWWSETGERELRQLLYWKWDPIGVNDSFPFAADEYDQYGPQIVQALRMGVSQDQIVDMLKAVERDRMGLSGDSGDLLRSLVTRLRGWFQQSQDPWAEFGPLRR